MLFERCHTKTEISHKQHTKYFKFRSKILLDHPVQVMKEAQEKAPSAILKSLVEKLRNDLAEKDKKQRAMSRD